LSGEEKQNQVGSRLVEGSGGGALGMMLIQIFQLIDDQTIREIAISSVPFISVLAGYLIHFCFQFSAADWPLIRTNRRFDKTEKRLRKQLTKPDVSEEEKEIVQRQLIELQKLRSEAEISRIKGAIETAPESAK